VGDVLDEGAVRADDEHALAAQPVRVREQEPRRAVQPDRGLPRPRAALHDEHALGLVRDQPVLVGLDRLDDVAHALVAAALQLIEQEVAERARLVANRTAERLVRDVQQPAALGAEAPAAIDALRDDRRRRVERPRRRRLPVHDHDALVVLVDPAAADVQGVPLVHVDPPEADPALGVLVASERARLPGLERKGREFARGGIERAADPLAHALQARVGVEIGLLGGEIGVRHGGRVFCLQGDDGEE